METQAILLTSTKRFFASSCALPHLDYRSAARHVHPIITNVILPNTKVIGSSDSITDVKTFGERLRHARHLRGMTQRELALASKVSQSAIGNYESDLRNSSRALLRLAQALDVSPAWLETGQLPMEPTAGRPYPMPARTTPSLRDEPTREPPAHPSEWLFDAEDEARYRQLQPEGRRFLRQTVRALMESLLKEASAPEKPAGTPARKPRR